MDIIKFGKEKGLKLGYYFIAFIVSKSAVYIAPILLSNYLSIETYGKFSYGLSVGSILAMVIGMGVAATYPVIILKERKVEYFPAFLLYIYSFVIVGGLVVIILSLFPSLKDVSYTWAFLIALIITIQGFFSTIFKTHAKQLLAVFIDSGLHIYLLVFIVLVKIIKVASFNNLFIVFIIYFLLLSATLLLVFRKRMYLSIATLNVLKTIISRGYPLVISSFLMMTITNSGILLIERFCSETDLAQYSFYWRLAAIVMLFHQFAGIMFFKKIFTAPAFQLDKYFTIFFTSLLFINVTAYFIIPLLGKPYLKLLSSYSQYQELYFLLAVLVIFWSITALNEALLYRENLVKKMNFKLIVIFFMASIILIIVSQFKNLQMLDFVKVHFTVIFIVLQLQIISLKSRKFNLRRLQTISSFVFAGTLIVDYLAF